MKELARIRSAHGWSQQRLSEESGVNKATINQIERGRRSPNVETLERLAAALGVELADFFPKAEAPLPFEEKTEQGRSSMLSIWTAYMLKRTQEWEQALPESGRNLRLGYDQRTSPQPMGTEADLEADLRADPRLALQIVDQSFLVASESTDLVVTSIEVRRNLQRVSDRSDLERFRRAFDLLAAAAEKWDVAWEIARRIVDEGDLRRAEIERAKEKAEEFRNVVALYREERSA